MRKYFDLISNSASLRFCLLFLALLIAYLPVLSGRPTVNPDAQLIMPILDEISGIGEYFNYLFSLKTFDIQPIRDLTLFWDWWIFKNFHFNSFVIQNLFYWIIACVFVEKITQNLFPQIDKFTNWISTLMFSVYPLFCATISWGIARKHVLAFMFIVMATHYFILAIQSSSPKNKYVVFFNVCYFLSIFSQPITVLWPMWALLYVYLFKKNEWLTLQKLLVPAYVNLLICVIANLHYYKYSQVFTLNFEAKTDDPLNVADKFLGLGHYFYQLFYPYEPSIFYELGHWTVWVGIFLAFIFYYVCLRTKLDRKWFLSWSAFCLLPLFVVLTNAHILSDNYLLVPALGLFILFLTFIFQWYPSNKKIIYWLSAPLLFAWIAITCHETKFWLNPIKFSDERGFERRPNCSSAINLARKSYALEKKIPSDAKDFLQHYECFDFKSKTPAVIASFIYLQTYILFYEQDLSLEERIEGLKKYAGIYWYSKAALAALYLQQKNETQANALINELAKEIQNKDINSYYDLIISDNIYPFCQRINNSNCLNSFEKFVQKPDLPYL